MCALSHDPLGQPWLLFKGLAVATLDGAWVCLSAWCLHSRLGFPNGHHLLWPGILVSSWLWNLGKSLSLSGPQFPHK